MTSNSASSQNLHFPDHRAAFAILIAVVLSVIVIPRMISDAASISVGKSRISHPFVWRDVAAVYLLSALPLAWQLAETGARSISRFFLGASGTVLCVGTWVVFFSRVDVSDQFLSVQSHGAWMRYTAAFSFVFGTALCLHALPLRPGVAAANPDSGMRFLQLSSGILVFLLIPAMYVTARCRYDAIRVAELRDQSRLGEARFLLVRVLALDRDCRCNGQPVRRDLPDLNSSLRALEARVANEMSESATIIERTERARELAIMGLTDKASEVLLASDECETNPEACGLLATISEHRGEWETALSKYLKCLELWRSIPDDNRRKEGIHAATMGTAVCYRKLGRIRQAKEAWLSLLDISPTAETHFLLAQFFEDIQDTARAHEHARKAMEISPSRYSEKCQALISKMQTLHFGCFGVYRSATTDQSHHEKSSAVPPTLKR